MQKHPKQNSSIHSQTKIAHWNINGLSSVALTVMINMAERENIDILAISETKQSIATNSTMTNYYTEWSFTRANHNDNPNNNQGGLLIAARKNDWTVTKIQQNEADTITDWAIWLLENKNLDQRILLNTTYRPPALRQDDDPRNQDDIDKLMKETKKGMEALTIKTRSLNSGKGKRTIALWFGDVNVKIGTEQQTIAHESTPSLRGDKNPTHQPKTPSTAKTFLSLLDENALLITSNRWDKAQEYKPTWEGIREGRSLTPSTIDYTAIHINDTETIRHTEILSTYARGASTDHNPIVLTLELKGKTSSTHNKEITPHKQRLTYNSQDLTDESKQINSAARSKWRQTMNNSEVPEMQQEIFDYMRSLQTSEERGEQPDLSKRQEFLDNIVDRWTQTLQSLAAVTFGAKETKNKDEHKNQKPRNEFQQVTAGIHNTIQLLYTKQAKSTDPTTKQEINKELRKEEARLKQAVQTQRQKTVRDISMRAADAIHTGTDTPWKLLKKEMDRMTEESHGPKGLPTYVRDEGQNLILNKKESAHRWVEERKQALRRPAEQDPSKYLQQATHHQHFASQVHNASLYPIHPTMYQPDGQKLEELLKERNSHIAPGPNGITYELLKYAGNDTLTTLAFIYLMMITWGLYPTAWKLLHMLPVYKKGDMNSTLNYRFLAMIETEAKLYDIILQRLIQDSTTYYNSKQGSQRLVGSAATVYAFVATIHYRKFRWNIATLIALIDYVRAYPQTHLAMLWTKMEKQGVPLPYIRALAASYDRTKYTILHPHLETTDTIDAEGLLEGRPSSPLAFEIATGDLGEEMEGWMKANGHDLPKTAGDLSALVLQYVDDLDLNAEDHTQMQNIIIGLCIYCHKYGISIHPEKSIFVHCFGDENTTNRPIFLHTITKDGQTTTPLTKSMQQQSLLTYLGLRTDSQLSMTHMMNHMIQKMWAAQKRIKLTAARPTGLQIQMRLTLYNAYVEAATQYLLEFLQQQHATTLHTHQTRAITNTFGTKCRADILRWELGIPTINEARQRALMRLYATLQTAPPGSAVRKLHHAIQNDLDRSIGPKGNRAMDAEMRQTLQDLNMSQHWPTLQIRTLVEKEDPNPYVNANKIRQKWKEEVKKAISLNRMTLIQNKIANAHAPTMEWTDTALHLATRRNQLSPIPLYKTLAKLHKTIPSETAEFFLYVRAQGIQEICSAHPRRLPNNTTAGGDVDYDPRCPCCKFMFAPTHNQPTPLGTPKHILRECKATETSRRKLDDIIEKWYDTRKITDTSRRATLQRWTDIPDHLKHALLMGTPLPHNYHTAKKMGGKQTWETDFITLTASLTHHLFKTHQAIATTMKAMNAPSVI